MKKIKFVQQLSESDCGIAALTMVLNYYGCKLHISDLVEKCSISRDGVHLRDLMNVANEYGLKSKAVELNKK